MSEKVKMASTFILQVDELTDTKWNMIAPTFHSFCWQWKNIQAILLSQRTLWAYKRSGCFWRNGFLFEIFLSILGSHVGVHTDNTPTLAESVWRCESNTERRKKKQNPNAITTHCFFHVKALVAETVFQELKSVFDQVVKVVLYIKISDHLKLLEEKIQK